MLNTDPHGFLYRIVAVVAGLAIIGFGVGPLLHGGDLFGTNWFGELVFAPRRARGATVHRDKGFRCARLAPCAKSMAKVFRLTAN